MIGPNCFESFDAGMQFIWETFIYWTENLWLFEWNSLLSLSEFCLIIITLRPSEHNSTIWQKALIIARFLLTLLCCWLFYTVILIWSFSWYLLAIYYILYQQFMNCIPPLYSMWSVWWSVPFNQIQIKYHWLSQFL